MSQPPEHRAVPILPAKDLATTHAFYEALGFAQVGGTYDHYLMVMRGAWELHFFLHPELDVTTNVGAAYLRSTRVAALHDEWSKLELPTDGQPRYHPAEAKEWGMFELAVIDPNGNLLRVGQDLET